MITRIPLIACGDQVIDRALTHCLNELGKWCEQRNVSLFFGHNMVDVHLRLKQTLEDCLNEAAAPPPPDDMRGRARKSAKAEISFNGQTYAIGEPKK